MREVLDETWLRPPIICESNMHNLNLTVACHFPHRDTHEGRVVIHRLLGGDRHLNAKVITWKLVVEEAPVQSHVVPHYSN